MAEVWKALKDPNLWKAALPHILVRLVGGASLALLWHFTLGSPGRDWDLVALLLAVFFLCLAWFRYLRYDGFLNHGLVSRRPEAMKKSLFFKDLVNTRPEPDELPEDKKERQGRSFLANLSAGVLFLISAVLAAV